jgi:hypothetical protein
MLLQSRTLLAAPSPTTFRGLSPLRNLEERRQATDLAGCRRFRSNSSDLVVRRIGFLSILFSREDGDSPVA